MDFKSKIFDSFDFNSIADKEWKCPKKGLRKELVNFKFESMTKPTEMSKCLVKISTVENLNNRETSYLACTEEFWIELGSAVTPIDVYTELFLQQMFAGETSRCYINTTKSGDISFILSLIKIDFNSYLFKLSVREMFDLAAKYKQNGVTMFKQYPLFAHEYFCRAAKCLISFQPFDVLTLKDDGVDPKELEMLFRTIQLNIAACLIKQGNFEDVIYLTKFSTECEDAPEKAIYRRAVAFYNLKKYTEAKETIEKIYNYNVKSEFSILYSKVLAELKSDTEQYNKMVKKMFR